MKKEIFISKEPFKFEIKAGLITQCAWCSRYRFADNSFGHADDKSVPDGVKVSHTICPPCLELTMAEMPADQNK